MDEDDDSAAWHQHELEGRQQREEEALRRCRPIAEQFKRDLPKWEREYEQFHKRILQESYRAKSQ